MADPISVVGLAAGVISLGLQVAGGITNYIDALNYRRQDISSVRQQNDALRNTLQAIKTPLSQFQRDHQDATAAVREWLDLCKNELEALERLIDNFTNKRKNLLYPFSRPKLEQLETRLRNANAALQLALQTLGLSVSQLGTEKLAALEATSHNISTNFLIVQSKISAMSIPIQGIYSNLSGIDTRFDRLEHLIRQQFVPQLASNGSSQEITPTAATYRLLAKPGVLRDICEAAGARARPRLSGTLPAINHGVTQIGSAVPTYAEGSFSCLCRHRRRLRHKNVAWGSLTLSLETAIEQHLPGCPATQIIVSTNRSRKMRLEYSGLRRLLNLVIQLSFVIPWGAGGWSLSSNITYYPIVDSEIAPVFRILDLMSFSRTWGCLDKVIWQEKFIPSGVSAILRLFRAKQASPQAVDANNRSLVYYLARCISMNNSQVERLPGQAEPNPRPLLDLLECLLVNKAPANDYDISGDTPLSHMFRALDYGAVIDPLPGAAAELILRSNTEDNVACLSRPSPAALSTILDHSGRHVSAKGTAVLLHFLACSTRIAEAYGCGPLSLAILSNNLEQVEHLVRNHPATLGERNLFGHTPLHLAADKPSCLRLLVKAADARLLNQTDDTGEFGMTALETAVFLSGWRCREPRGHHRMCRQCRCAECAVVLLKADCALPVPARLQSVFGPASKRCKLRYVRHMKDRRDRLKQLALDNLLITEVERLGLESDRVLDSLAPRVIQLLQERGICIPGALAVVRNKPLPVYRALCCPWDGELFFRVGFHDTDSWCNANEAELKDTGTRCQGLPYLHWLAKHGATSCQLKSFKSARDIYTAHFIFLKIGAELERHWRGENLFPELIKLLSPLPDYAHGRRAWIHELHAAALPANIADPCRCKCAPGGCTPLTSLLKSAVDAYGFKDDMGRFKEYRVAEDTDFLEESVAEGINSLEDCIAQDLD